tara:strand:+ start:6677 stop:7456 length:780 start_codon:yes stop_codon:yes gene_type:complete
MKKNYLSILEENGILVIPNYFTKIQCNKIIDQINHFKNKDKIVNQRDEGMGGDLRIFNFEDYSPDVLKFANDSILKDLVSNYAKTPLETKSVLAGKVVFNKYNETNSGGDWHRDGDVSQMKAMVYLSEVNNQNGPFTFIKNSKNFDFKRRNNKYPFIQRLIFKLKGLPIKPPRYKHDEIINQPEMRENIFKVLGKAGTLVLFDGRYIHRGDVIKSGSRYSLTNYYYPLTKKDTFFYIKGFIKNIMSLNNPIINNKHEKK